MTSTERAVPARAAALLLPLLTAALLVPLATPAPVPAKPARKLIRKNKRKIRQNKKKIRKNKHTGAHNLELATNNRKVIGAVLEQIADGSLKGEKGEQGPKGDRGPKGDQGPKGDPGPPGDIDGVAASGDLTGAYPGPSLANGVVDAAQLAGGAVTRQKIADDAINSAKVEDESLTGDDIDESTLGEVPEAARAGGITPVHVDHTAFATADLYRDDSVAVRASCSRNYYGGTAVVTVFGESDDGRIRITESDSADPPAVDLYNNPDFSSIDLHQVQTGSGDGLVKEMTLNYRSSTGATITGDLMLVSGNSAAGSCSVSGTLFVG